MLITTDTITEKLRLHKQLFYTSAYCYAPCAVCSAGRNRLFLCPPREWRDCAYALEFLTALSLEVCAALLCTAGELL